MNDLVHLRAQARILLGQAFPQKLLVETGQRCQLLMESTGFQPHRLVVHFLCVLIRPESQSAASALHDGVGVQPAQYAGFVVFGRVQNSRDCVVEVGENALTSWTATVVGGGT